DAFMEYCTCNNLGLDNWKTLNRGRDIEACSELRAEDEEERVQELRVNAENYLDLKVRTRVEDGSDELRDVCGSRCGVVRATFINKGEFGGAGKDITVNGFYLEIRGGVEGGKLPMIIASDKITEAGGEKGKKYKLDYFINGRDTQGEWQSSRDVGIEIAPGQEKTVTFLANITPYHTYTRKCVNSEMKSQRDTVKSELEEDKDLTVEDYCSERGGIYQGEELKASEKSSQKYNAEKFNEYSGQICNEQAKDAVEGCVDEDKIFTEYRSEFKPAVVVNYTSTTSNKLDAIALNSQKWNEMTLEKRKDFEEDNCIGREGQILRQSPDNSQLIDAVSLIIQSDCTGLRYDPEEPSESEGSVHVSAKGDSEEITAFKVNSITRPEGTEEICTEETKYKDLGSEGWFKCDSEDCKTKEMSCKKRVPPIPDGETTALNFGLEAEYTARTVEEGRFILSGIS
ncbi:MAG: hypothetical protein SVV03_02950, partial [Candidatus Nanohaloarchaea archaeon]|nr:hypothetical protein [Candidatus Nanohaloarchaea archaeon]